ncbi:MAG: nitronate monooxygenase [Hyphomonadaceae bacterium]|nr:nitronate monooxygenase [Hyphomonadaceae bacterium]
MLRTEITERLGIQHPIVQGPFGGGISTPQLVAEVGKAGGLGSFGAYTLSAHEIEDVTNKIRALSNHPFALNLWVSDHDRGGDRLTPEQFDAAWKIFKPLYDEFELEKPVPPVKFFHGFETQIEAVLEARPAAFSFVFGVPKGAILAECSRRGITTIGAVTTLAEAEAMDAAGVDVILTTGFEAAGHRPSFLGSAELSLMGTLTLTRLVAAKIKRRPVIAAGGIVDRPGIQAALDLGAAGAQLGTAFLACEESGTTKEHRDALFGEGGQRTVLTRTYSGRLARGIPNRLIEALTPYVDKLPPFPIEVWFTSPLRKAAAAQGRTDFLALYAGQGAPLLKHRRVADLMADLTAN